MLRRTVFAVVLAGISGVVAAAVAGSLYLGAFFGVLAFLPEVHALAVLLTAAVPFIFGLLPGARGAVLTLFFLTLAPVLLYMLFSGLKDWNLVLGLSFAYALAALAVYRLVAGDHHGVAES